MSYSSFQISNNPFFSSVYILPTDWQKDHTNKEGFVNEKAYIEAQGCEIRVCKSWLGRFIVFFTKDKYIKQVPLITDQGVCWIYTIKKSLFQEIFRMEEALNQMSDEDTGDKFVSEMTKSKNQHTNYYAPDHVKEIEDEFQSVFFLKNVVEPTEATLLDKESIITPLPSIIKSVVDVLRNKYESI